MKKSRRKFSKEFKQKAVELSNLRGSVQEIARELGICPDLINRWRRIMGKYPFLAFSGISYVSLTTEQKELIRQPT